MSHSTANRNITGLDGLRAIAVSLVVAYHYGFSGVPGGYGVTLFFVLSGYLITRLLLQEHHRDGRPSLTRFYIRRALRIFPAFYIYWGLIVLALLVTGRNVPWAHAWSSFVYLSNYYNAILGDPNTAFSHTWSLAIEEQFYLLWPLSLIVLLRQPQWLLARVTILIGVLWVLRLVLVGGFEIPQGYVYASFETRADALLVGCAGAIAMDNPAMAARLQRLFRSPSVVLASAGLVALIAVAEGKLGSGFRDTVALTALPLLFLATTVHVVVAQRGPVARILEYQPLRYIGRISYGIYLYQQVAVSPVRRMMTGQPLLLQVLAIFTVVIGLATVSYVFVERPFLRLKERFA